MRSLPLAALAVFASLTALPLSALSQTTDLVYLSSGMGTAPKRGTIVSMTANEVKLDMAGVEQAYPVNEIKQIKFADEPTPLDNARNAINSRNFNSALTELDKIDVKTLKREVEKQEVAFLRAYCLAQQAMTEGGDKNAAETALRDFAKVTSGQHYRFYQTAETLGDLALASGKFDDAVKYYGDTGLAGAPWPEYKLRANLSLGRAQYLGGKFEDALKSYEAVLASQLASPEVNLLKEFAQVGKGACLAETGKAEEGITLVKEVIKKNDPLEKRLFAHANNALGNCYLKMNRPKDAMLAFLQTDILFRSDGDAHAEALYHLAKLGDSLDRSNLATESRNTLRQQYAGSYWLTRQ
jgi:tetratricopeptide (TPR) repeat protein